MTLEQWGLFLMGPAMLIGLGVAGVIYARHLRR